MIKKSLLIVSKPIVNPITSYILRNYYQDNKAIEKVHPKQKILLLVPHADDETIGLGGTISVHADNDCDVYCILLTDGSNSTSKWEKDQLIKVRKQEMESVQKILGITEMEYWNLPDGKLKINPFITRRLKEKINHLQPDIIYCPTYVDAHPDHVATAEILMHTLSNISSIAANIRLYEVNCPLPKPFINCVIDISDQLDRKITAIQQFTSQAIAFDGFIQLAKVKRHMTKQQVRAVETFVELSPEQFIHSAQRLFSHPSYQQFPSLFKQANRTQTLLWALFQHYEEKVSIYKQLLHD